MLHATPTPQEQSWLTMMLQALQEAGLHMYVFNSILVVAEQAD
jgi:hypothetical protein